MNSVKMVQGTWSLIYMTAPAKLTSGWNSLSINQATGLQFYEVE